MDVQPDWYDRWAVRHCTAFLLPDAWLDAAKAWRHVFDLVGATEAELDAATREVQASDAPPKYPGDHLPAVKTAVGRVRDRLAERARKAAADAAADGRGVCDLCADTGWVVVPHPLHVRAGCWEPTHHARGEKVYVTACATCRCYRGRKTFDGLAERERRPLSLDRLEAVNPHWRAMLAGRDRAAAELFAAVRTAETWEPAVLKRLAAGTRMPRG